MFDRQGHRNIIAPGTTSPSVQAIQKILLGLKRLILERGVVELIGHPGRDIDLEVTMLLMGKLCLAMGAKEVHCYNRCDMPTRIAGVGESLVMKELHQSAAVTPDKAAKVVSIWCDCNDPYFLSGGFAVPVADFIVDHHKDKAVADYLLDVDDNVVKAEIILPSFGCAALVADLLCQIYFGTANYLDRNLATAILASLATDIGVTSADFPSGKMLFHGARLSPYVIARCAELYKLANKELLDLLVDAKWRAGEYLSLERFALENLEIKSCQFEISPDIKETGAVIFAWMGDIGDSGNRDALAYLASRLLYDCPPYSDYLVGVEEIRIVCVEANCMMHRDVSARAISVRSTGFDCVKFMHLAFDEKGGGRADAAGLLCPLPHLEERAKEGRSWRQNHLYPRLSPILSQIYRKDMVVEDG